LSIPKRERINNPKATSLNSEGKISRDRITEMAKKNDFLTILMITIQRLPFKILDVKGGAFNLMMIKKPLISSLIPDSREKIGLNPREFNSDTFKSFCGELPGFEVSNTNSPL
jgi:hypothetical protein